MSRVQWQHENVKIVKYADHTAIIRRISNDDEKIYQVEIENVTA